ncbi:MAG TPA: arginine repressor [Sphingomicrobium sp.]|nr:arginine repressor [Sphingomicrobium sp.]
MTDAKARRQRAIAELIRNEVMHSQEEVAHRLSAMGFVATQATVSRDLVELGAVKVRRDGMIAYALPADTPPPRTAAKLETVIREWVQSVRPAGNLLVMKTPPGSAHVVGFAIDQARLEEVVGTICGDDTIFIAFEKAADAKSFADKLQPLAGAG